MVWLQILPALPASHLPLQWYSELELFGRCSLSLEWLSQRSYTSLVKCGCMKSGRGKTAAPWLASTGGESVWDQVPSLQNQTEILLAKLGAGCISGMELWVYHIYFLLIREEKPGLYPFTLHAIGNKNDCWGEKGKVGEINS